MSKDNDTAAAPHLPPASVDFNKLHAACKAGQKPETAAKHAIVAGTVAERPEPEALGEALETHVDGPAPAGASE